MEQVQEKLMIFGLAISIGFILLYIAYNRGLFNRFKASQYPKIGLKDVILGFSFYLFAQLISISLISHILKLFFKIQNFEQLGAGAEGWINFAIILCSFFGVYLAYFFLADIKKQQLWSQTKVIWIENLWVGILTWVVSFPFVIAFGQLISLFVWSIFHHAPIEQIAVQQMRKILADPWLFGITTLSVATIVPLTEEYLFRGLLQNYFKGFLGNSTGAVVLSSIIFTAFHYSSAQGLANYELLPSLFILSCLLGFIYERQRSLWAPVGLHGFFNLMSVIFLFQE